MMAFVEGSMERQFINRFMKYIRVIPVDNGITWTIERMCIQICDAYEALDLQGTVFVWIDREGRTETADEIRVQIHDALVHVGAPKGDIHILVNDRMSENVILADQDLIRSKFGREEYQYEFEGRSGKQVLKNMFKDIDVNYKETIHGVEMLKGTRISRSALNSPSVAAFLDTFTAQCWWVQS